MKYINTTDQYIQAIEELQPYKELALDTETCIRPEWVGKGGSALDPHTGKLSLLQLGTKEEVYVFDIICLEEQNYSPSLIVNLLDTRDYLLGHNIKFDAKHLKGTLNYLPSKLRDTMIMSKLLGNAIGSKFAKRLGHSLADLCREYLNIKLTGKTEERLTDWGVPLSSRSLNNQYWLDKITYAAKDVEYLFKLQDILLPVLVNPLPPSATNPNKVPPPYGLGMGFVVDLEFQTIEVTASMEYHGMSVNPKLFEVINEAIDNRLNNLAVEISKDLGLDTEINPFTGTLVPSASALKSLRSAVALPNLLVKATKLKKINDTQAKTLQRIVDIIEALGSESDLVLINEEEEELKQELELLEQGEIVSKAPVIKKVIEFKKLVKQQGMKLETYINPKTGRIHPSFDQLGTATGRYACIAKGQRVLTKDGLKPIEEIKVGEEVFSNVGDDFRLRKVLNTFKNGIKKTVKVNWIGGIDNKTTGTVICTPDHKFLLENDDSWREASELKQYDKIVCLTRAFGADHLRHTSHIITSVEPHIELEVYDLEVDEEHNYVVEDLCVHNCNSPNAQQVPARFSIKASLNTSILDPETNEDITLDISPRMAFTCTDKNRVLIDIDFSSQEALLAAAVSGDSKLIDIYKQPSKKRNFAGVEYKNPWADIHTLMTKNCCYPELFIDAPEEQWIEIAQTPIENGVVPRQRGKILSYGSIYMQGAKTMSEGNYVPLDEAKKWIDLFKKAYPEFNNWASENVSISETTGMSTNINGRHRWCAESNSKGNEDSAGRTGVNHQIQSLAADIGKLSLIRIHRALKGTKSFIVAPIH